jgi:methylaspartate mutase sigma subunit
MSTPEASATEALSKGTVVTGVIGDDVHVIGIRLMEYALRQTGFTVVSLGPLAQPKEFIEAAIETAADALFISSLNGHAELYLPGLRGACVEAGIGDILIFAGGQLTIRRPDWADVERRFVNEIGLSRVYPSDVSPDVPIADLGRDIEARRAAKTAAREA